MRLLVKSLLPVILLLAGTDSASAAGGVIVNVEAMIGVATFTEAGTEGEQGTILVPTGKVTVKDPKTGEIMVAPATVRNAVNAIVHAIVAAAPDSSTALPTDEGCSESDDPLRKAAQPEYDAESAAAIAKELEGMSSGDLMMIIAVMINNAQHLCIDADTVANTIALIITIRPEEAGNLVFLAALLDPTNANRYADAARRAAPDKARIIDKAREDADRINDRPTPRRGPPPINPPIKPERDIPPGGNPGRPPSPE